MNAATATEAREKMGDSPSPSATIERSESPSIFLSPRITSDLDKSFDAIEELLLAGDHGEHSPSPSTAVVARSPNATLTIHEESHFSEANTSLSTNYSLANAVHMEVQENAKLPTFNLPVDRSNASWQIPAPRGRRSLGPGRRTVRPNHSSSFGSRSGAISLGSGSRNGDPSGLASAPLSPLPKLGLDDPDTDPSTSEHGQMEMDPATSRAIDEILRLTENDVNLSELFLDVDDRSSAALAYSNSCTPHSQLATPVEEVTGGKGAHGVIAKDGHQSAKSRAHAHRTGSLSPRRSKQVLPYNRQKPLPIPTLGKPSLPRDQTFAAAAVATAAAIADRTSPRSKSAGLDPQTAAALSVQPAAVVNHATPPAVMMHIPQKSVSTQPHMAFRPIPMPATKPSPGGQIPRPKMAPRLAPVSVLNSALGATIPPRQLVSGPDPVAALKPGPRAHVAARPGPHSITLPKGSTPAAIPKHRPAPTRPTLTPPPNGLVSGNRPQSVSKYPPGHPYTAQAHARARQLAAHSKTKGSIAHATVQRSKFGFGGNHRVPSVPAPPPNVKGHPIRVLVPAGKTPAAAAVALKPAGKPHLRPVVPPVPFPRAGARIASAAAAILPKDAGSVVAYERKKQRAKDSRVRLNEAIEDLAVAIDLAGSQSKERLNYVTRAAAGATDGRTVGGKVPASGPPWRNPLAQLMNDTIRQAATMKKWDRPAFVGLSATVIHSLNAQCEGLMREVAQLRRFVTSRDVTSSADTATLGAPINCTSMIQASAANSNGVESQQDGVHKNETTPPVHAAKKQKLDSSTNEKPTFQAMVKVQTVASQVSLVATKERERCSAISKTVEATILLKNIASFLDPSMLRKCLCVSKRWRSQNIFEDPELWLNICIKRFGVSSVRKWQDEEDDVPNLDLYCQMSKKNVKPHRPMEGSIFLGGSTLDGLVSCWVSLMDRSNGETSRSVMQQKLQEGETRQYYRPVPVVELRLLVQNTGYSEGIIIIPNQQFSIDASTRRKGEKMLEVGGDERFKHQVLHIEHSLSSDGRPSPNEKPLGHEMCRLRLFELAVLSVHIHARGCSTTAKFCNRSKFITLLVSINGTTRPLTVPFHCVNEHQLKKSSIK